MADAGGLSFSVGGSSATKESLTDAKPVILDEILEKPTEGVGAATPKEQMIIKQVEHYFGDENLARDKFLKIERTKDNGWVTLVVMLRFKLLAALSTDANVIVDALLKSTNDLLQISNDRKKLRRNPARTLPAQQSIKSTQQRTAKVEGFPVTADIPAVLQFFDGFEGVVNVFMRRKLHEPSQVYKFVGSVLVTFDNRENCSKFMAKQDVHFEGGVVLKRNWQ